MREKKYIYFYYCIKYKESIVIIEQINVSYDAIVTLTSIL